MIPSKQGIFFYERFNAFSQLDDDQSNRFFFTLLHDRKEFQAFFRFIACAAAAPGPISDPLPGLKMKSAKYRPGKKCFRTSH